jgi:ubiquinone/menaquinone biosynthesis C-methylase UbiE
VRIDQWASMAGAIIQGSGGNLSMQTGSMDKQFDSDTAALKRRLQTNVAGATHDLEEWILRQVSPRAGMRVLDLGCGTGKQSFAVARLVGATGEVLGLDISAEAVRELNERARGAGSAHVRAMQESLDECLERLKSLRFDRIISAYAIYYARHMVPLISGLRSLLRPDGEVFVCGPGRGTNQEILQLIERVAQQPSQRPPPVEDFLSSQDIRQIAGHYARSETVRLPNQIRFDSLERLLTWWENHNSFVPAIRDQVARALQAEFAAGRGFRLTKNVLGVHLYAQ